MINVRQSKVGYGPALVKRGGEGSAGLPRCVSHEAEKQFHQTKGYRQGGIFSTINANDVTTFPPAHIGGGRKAHCLGAQHSLRNPQEI